jgi:hypothetical protein
MNRFGVTNEECGGEQHALRATGPCFSCMARAVRRGRWMLRQLLPLKYATHYFTGGTVGVAEGCEPNAEFVNVDYWRMWFGKVFAHEHNAFRVVDA